MNEPRILTLTGTAHPKALVQRIDPANGILVFAWLDERKPRKVGWALEPIRPAASPAAPPAAQSAASAAAR